MAFGSFRKEGFPTHFKNQHSAAHTDILYAGLICAIIILSLSFLIGLPGISGWKKKCKLMVHLFVAIFVGSVIITCNYGHSWEVGKVKISSPYKPASSEEIKGELGIKIALRGINITLTGEARNPTGQLTNEVIDYNEHFSWEWAQGRFGFGYYAGRISRDFRAAVLRGSPLPILQLAEYFTFDGEGLRFGRYYRWAGWYSHALMWAAFPTWIISLIFFRNVVSKGATFMVITGVLQLIAIIIWSTLRNPLEIIVPFESEDQVHEVTLTTKYGADYYLVLVTSLLCIVGGATLFVVNLFYPEYLCNLFGIDVQTLYKEVALTQEELNAEKNNAQPYYSGNDIEMSMPNNNENQSQKNLEGDEEDIPKKDRITVRLTHRNTYLGKRNVNIHRGNSRPKSQRLNLRPNPSHSGNNPDEEESPA